MIIDSNTQHVNNFHGCLMCNQREFVVIASGRTKKLEICRNFLKLLETVESVASKWIVYVMGHGRTMNCFEKFRKILKVSTNFQTSWEFVETFRNFSKLLETV